MVQSTRIALLTFLVGFVFEGTTEAYQFVSIGYLSHGWIGFYYVGLVTTGVGFYLMYRGRHEWSDVHHRAVRRGHHLLYTGIALFLLATIAIAILGSVDGGPGSSGPPAWMGWGIGGLVAVALGMFFLSLLSLVHHLASRGGRLLAWTAFGWSLGVSVLTGLAVGRDFLTLLQQFFTNPLMLIASFAPLAFVMATLFVTYFLFVGAYLDAYIRLRRAGPMGIETNVDHLAEREPTA